jgi:two-component system response regulator YesN
MHSLLIVDDQKIVREGICQMLQNLGMTFAKIYQAANSRTAIEIIDKHHPDILLLDIVMPGGDGFTVVKHIKERGIPVSIVIITSYDEFDYAVKALKYNVRDFMLKPINEVELYQSLYQIMHSNSGEHIESTMFYYILLGCYLEGKQIQIDVDQLYMHTGLSKFDHGKIMLCRVQLKTANQNAHHFIRQVTDGLRDRQDQLVYYPRAEDEFILIMSEEIWPEPAREIVLQAARQSGSYNICTSDFGMRSELRLLYREAAEAAAYVMQNNLSHAVLHFSKADMIKHIIMNAESAIKSAIQAKNENELHEQVDRVFRQLIIAEDELSLIQSEVDGLVNALQSNAMSDDKIDWHVCSLTNQAPFRSLLALKAAALSVLKQIMETTPIQGDLPVLVKKMIQLVHQQYCRDISLAAVANDLHINYNHASGLFNRYTGMNFCDYLNKLRLEKAAELLTCSDIKISDIAEKTGFASEKYFFRKFKAYYDMTPGAYRDRQSAGVT